MRMWMINPKMLCRKHLLGEHVECHMLAGHLHRRKSIRGYVEKGLVEVQNIKARHDELAAEMVRRGYNHDDSKQLKPFPERFEGKVNRSLSQDELYSRCPECRQLIVKFQLNGLVELARRPIGR